MLKAGVQLESKLKRGEPVSSDVVSRGVTASGALPLASAAAAASSSTHVDKGVLGVNGLGEAVVIGSGSCIMLSSGTGTWRGDRGNMI